MAPHTPALQAHQVDVVRDGRLLLDGVSLTVHPGEHWALLGPNGAGKTTLFSLLGAVSHPTRGTVQVLGHTLGRVDLQKLRGLIGHVNPRHPLRSALTVSEVVLTGLTGTIESSPRWTPTPAQGATADKLIAMLGLSERADTLWPVLSQGERGRVLIARALMPDPGLLLLDEPATGLDLPGREQLVESIDILQRARPELASVIVTHHLEELPSGTTHAALLRAGRVLYSGPVDEVLTSRSVSDCFGCPVALTRSSGGRWHAEARRDRAA
ncbi:ATP-binding cassette domain-containing protein [Kitasatospora sp. NBC_00240]|uniref:ABC transporter ATP-binding protein n=1 Tax=Kitasatospora sp. NBC_00240 TaxID=2903567 RepID=UPI0022542455|nr:ATP-binding cassette domain-containing protein [Kitasatospora sp. NBC_00240]MCX5214698.1 ATP-binding cassette domain-containing protein [Kitasatospora sp. NBC_00240]